MAKTLLPTSYSAVSGSQSGIALYLSCDILQVRIHLSNTFNTELEHFSQHKKYNVCEERDVEGSTFYPLFQYSSFEGKSRTSKGFKKAEYNLDVYSP